MNLDLLVIVLPGRITVASLAGLRFIALCITGLGLPQETDFAFIRHCVAVP